MTNRQYLTGAQTIIATLRAYDVDTIFGIPGVHTLPIYEAIYQEPNMRHILARHEQGAGFMAEGYARASGRPGVVCTITGPGATNVATPMASAYSDSIPLLVISTIHDTSAILQGKLHEIKDQLGMMTSLAGWTRAINSVEEIPLVLSEAFHIMRHKRPRGAYLQIPISLLETSAYVEIDEPQLLSLPLPDPENLQAAIQLLQDAERPLIIAGAGVTVSQANNALLDFAEYLQAPVILSSKSHDVLPSIHPLAISTNDTQPLSLDTFIAQSDLVFVVGSKLGAVRTADGRLPLSPDLIHVDIDPEEIGRNYPARLGLVGDARIILTELTRMLHDYPRKQNPLLQAMGTLRRALFSDILATHDVTFPMLDGVNAALAELPKDTIVVADMTMLSYAAAQFLPTYQPRTFIHPAELCTIGCGLPLALGARLAAPHQTVIALCGDGGFLLNASELATAAQEHISVIIVVFNDSTYTTVKKDQQKRFPQHYIATDLLAPDYVMLAQAYHAYGVHVSTPAALSQEIQTAHQRPGPTVIDAQLPPQTW